MLCCGYTLTDFPISIRLSSLALWQSNDCPSASKATLMNMEKYFMWIHYERLHNNNKAKHNKTVCIFLGIYCIIQQVTVPAAASRDRSAAMDVSWWWFTSILLIALKPELSTSPPSGDWIYLYMYTHVYIYIYIWGGGVDYTRWRIYASVNWRMNTSFKPKLAYCQVEPDEQRLLKFE